VKEEERGKERRGVCVRFSTGFLSDVLFLKSFKEHWEAHCVLCEASVKKRIFLSSTTRKRDNISFSPHLSLLQAPLLDAQDCPSQASASLPFPLTIGKSVGPTSTSLLYACHR
jgi:hypothetical protein